MKNNPTPESGLYTMRVLLALLLVVGSVGLTFVSLKAGPSSSVAAPETEVPSAPSEPDLVQVTTPNMPRYYNYAPGPGMGESAAEPSIGFNPITKKVMFISGLQTLRVTLPEKITPLGSVPDSCNALWEDVSFPTTSVRSADPILFTNPVNGRTFVSQLNTVTQTSPVLVGLNSLMAYTDDDGDNWTPAQINPPDGSNDHQTVGGGPYPASLSSLSNPTNGGQAVYYCGQGGYVFAITSIAYCSRSDDGGLNFGRAVPAYANATSGCAQAIHGSVKVAPDGTVYLPNAQCNGGQAVAVSTDAGTTWTLRQVAGSVSPAGGAILDPSVGISKDPPIAPATSNTMYIAYVGGSGSGNDLWVTSTKDRGLTWSTPANVSASLGLQNVAFPATVVGDSNRAAVAFLGTTTSGNHQAAGFTGTWYGFVAHTYDGGQTWTTVNATPEGPVQRNACIWNGGGSNPCRNLLDFNGATLDDKGRVLFAFADGCVGPCEKGGTNSYSAKATIARQSGGRGLYSIHDTAEPVAPRAACLSACRDDKAAYLTWAAPDNGGSDITMYNIYRSDATQAETLIGQQTNPSDRTFNDRTVDPAVTSYSYRITAVNPQGESQPSNAISVPVSICLSTAGACELPGVTTVVDPAGDATSAQPAHDITSVSIAEPMDAGNPTGTGKASNVVLTIKVVDLTTVPQGWRWVTRFGVVKNGQLVTAPPSGIPGDTSASDYFVSMVSDGGASAGTTGPLQLHLGSQQHAE